MDYHSIDFFDDEKIIAGYTTGGEGHWHDHTKEDWPHFTDLAETFGLKITDLIRTRQRHTDAILPVGKEDGGGGILRELGAKKRDVMLQKAVTQNDESKSGDFHIRLFDETSPENDLQAYDGLITTDAGLMLTIVTADCVPIFLYDPRNLAIGLVHSGREGCAKEIAARAVEKMQECYGTNSAELLCYLGPYLSAKHHEVQEKDLEGFYKNFSESECKKIIASKNNGHYQIDMGQAIEATLTRAGVKPENIQDDHVCTFEHKELYSWRRDHDPDARILSFMMIAK